MCSCLGKRREQTNERTGKKIRLTIITRFSFDENLLHYKRPERVKAHKHFRTSSCEWPFEVEMVLIASLMFRFSLPMIVPNVRQQLVDFYCGLHSVDTIGCQIAIFTSMPDQMNFFLEPMKRKRKKMSTKIIFITKAKTNQQISNYNADKMMTTDTQ